MTTLEETTLTTFEHKTGDKTVEAEVFIEATDINVKLFNGIDYSVYSRVTKINSKGRWFKWELNVPNSLNGLIEVFGQSQVFAWAIRQLLTDHTNMVAQMDLAKSHSDLKKAFLHLNHSTFVKKLYDQKKGKVIQVTAEVINNSIDNMDEKQLEAFMARAQAKIAEKQALPEAQAELEPEEK
jgi:hypothetical protein